MTMFDESLPGRPSVQDLAVLPDLDPDRAEVDHGIKLFEGPGLPGQPPR